MPALPPHNIAQLGPSIIAARTPVAADIVHGSSDRIGARPSSQPVTPADIVATIYQCLGIPAELELRDRQNRPFQLVPWGSVVGELRG